MLGEKKSIKLMGAAIILTVFMIGSVGIGFANTLHSATAVFSRSLNISGCVQNYSVFQIETGTTYQITSRCPSGITTLNLCKYNSGTSTFDTIGSRINSIGGVSIQGHGASCEVVEYNNKYYYLFVDETNTEVKRVGCSELHFTFDGSGEISGWSLQASTTHYLTLFPTYQGKQIINCLLATSNNYVCIATSYGTDITNDKERFHIYNKANFMNYLTGSNKNQLALNSIRYGTGMFSSGSLGLNVGIGSAVIQSIELDELAGSDDIVTIFGAIDDRTNRMSHQINRVYLQLSATPTIATQDLSDNHSYYSSVDTLIDGNSSISMNWSDIIDERFELEGLKKIYGLSNPNIPNGWYVSVHSHEYIKEEYVGSWNYKFYKAETTPTVVYHN